MCFEALRGSPKGKAQRGQYLLAVDLSRYRWYQSQTPDDVSAFSLFFERVSAFSLFFEGGWIKDGVPVRMLSPKGGGFSCGPTLIGERNKCQREHWAPKGVDCDVPHWLGKKTKHHL